MRALALILPFLLLVAEAEAGRMYKWVDDEGNVHYSDSIPPEEAKERREREVKSDSGQTVDVIKPPPTEEELEQRQRERREAERKREAAEERRQRQAERDRALLKMFSSVEDMHQARDDRLEAIDAQIKLRRARIDKLDKRLDEQRARASRLERSDRGDPEPVYREIRRLNETIAGHEAFIQRQQQEKDRIRERFARNIERYRELKDDSDG